MTDCSHDDLLLGSDIARAESSGQQWLCVRLSIRCAVCQVLFSWVGVAAGVPSPSEPTASADGYELRAPIVPRPGATVGMLLGAGLEDRLLHPDRFTSNGDLAHQRGDDDG